jgi:hypothetical protein
MFHNVRLLLLTSALGSLVSSAALAQGGAADYDLKLVPAKKLLHEKDQFNVDSTVVVRQPGVLGWSYGVSHDRKALDIVSVTTEGSDVPSLFKDGFNQTKIITDANGNAGWIQAIVLAFQETCDGGNKCELPISSGFVMAKAMYVVRDGQCTPGTQIPTSISYTDQLAVPGSPPVEINLTINGNSIDPTKKDPAEVTVDCPAAGQVEIVLAAGLTENRKLTADTKDTMKIEIRLDNEDFPNDIDVQGWSYGLNLDPAVLEVVDLTSGPDAMALNAGLGPDFRAYNFKPLDQSADGKTKGITVGVVVSLDPPNNVLVVPPKQVRKIEILTVKSAATLAAGQPDVSSDLVFVSNVLGGDRPIENIITVEGVSVSPETDTPSVTVTLTAPTTSKKFRRGFSNPDDRLDLADGIWTIRVLFYQQGTFGCQKAADINDDGKIDLADAVYNFNYLLRGGPAPHAPFATCGDDPTSDQLTCATATLGCN